MELFYVIFGVIAAITGIFAGIACSKEDDRAVDEMKRKYARDRIKRILYIEDGVWFCVVENAHACNGRGDTPEAALKASQDYVQEYLDRKQKDN